MKNRTAKTTITTMMMMAINEMTSRRGTSPFYGSTAICQFIGEPVAQSAHSQVDLSQQALVQHARRAGDDRDAVPVAGADRGMVVDRSPIGPRDYAPGLLHDQRG